MDTIPKRKLLPSPITLVVFGLAFAVYAVFAAWLANLPPLPHKTDFVDNDVGVRLVRSLHRVHGRTVDSICVVEVDLLPAVDPEASIDLAAIDPEVALQDFAGTATDPDDPPACHEGNLGSLH
jgi:hypothetical protein